MKYVKFIARPNTWFKEGTEAFINHEDRPRRFTVEEWAAFRDEFAFGSFDFIGIRIPNPKFQNEIALFGDQERVDGEWCMFSEFDIIEAEEAKNCPYER